MEELCRYCQYFYVDDEDKCRCGYDKPHECDEPCYVDDLDECIGEFKPTKCAVESVDKFCRLIQCVMLAIKDKYYDK